MGQYNTNAIISLDDMRTIIDSYKPFDTGYLFTFGNRYNENEHYQVAIYDLITVPYIQFLEEGTKFSQRHAGFISQKTVTAINNANASALMKADKNVQSRTSMISQGVLEHVKGYGQQGGRYDVRSGVIQPTDKRTKEYFVGV